MIDFPPKNILVPYEFSARCRQAWDCAQGLARRFGAAVEALHVRSWIEPDGTLIENTLSADARSFLERGMASALPGLPGSAYRVSEGWSPDEILRRAREKAVELVVMARGADCEAVAKACPVPVLALRGPGAINSVIAPIGALGPGDAALEAAARVAAALGVPMTLAHLAEIRLLELRAAAPEALVVVARGAESLLRRSKLPLLIVPETA